METLSLGQIKKQASCFLHEKYKNVKLFLTDVTQAELLAEEATNNEPCNPDAKTMSRIAEASYDVDDYWRIVDVLHRRLRTIDWKHWRQSYKSLILLDFLLTHGPEEFAEDFNMDIGVIQDLGTFKHKDEKGIDWGLNMQKRSERILLLLQREETLIQERLKAQKITNEIKGFGNLVISPSSSSSASPSSYGTLGSFSSGVNSAISSGSGTSSVLSELEENNHDNQDENGSLIELEDEKNEDEQNQGNVISKICSRLGISPRGSTGKKTSFISIPNDDEPIKKLQRQFSVP